MGAVWTWVRADLRQRPLSMVVLILLIGLSTGVALAAAAGAHRTDTAYDRFLESSRSATHRVQYTSDADIDGEVLARLRADPAVEEVVLLNFFIGFSDATDLDIAVVSSRDQAFLRDVDRLRLVEGRLPAAGAHDEVVVNELLARSAGIGPGDRLPLATVTPQQLDGEDFAAGPQGPLLDLEVVGVGRFPDDLADDATAYAFAGSGFFEAADGHVGAFGPDLDIILRPGADASATVASRLRGPSRRRSTDPGGRRAAVRSRPRRHQRPEHGAAPLRRLCRARRARRRRPGAHPSTGRPSPGSGGPGGPGGNSGPTGCRAVLSSAPIVGAGALLAIGVAVVGSRWMPIGPPGEPNPHPESMPTGPGSASVPWA